MFLQPQVITFYLNYIEIKNLSEISKIQNKNNVS